MTTNVFQAELLEKMAEKMYSKFLVTEDRFETRDEILTRLEEFFNKSEIEEIEQE